MDNISKSLPSSIMPPINKSEEQLKGNLEDLLKALKDPAQEQRAKNLANLIALVIRNKQEELSQYQELEKLLNKINWPLNSNERKSLEDAIIKATHPTEDEDKSKRIENIINNLPPELKEIFDTGMINMYIPPSTGHEAYSEIKQWHTEGKEQKVFDACKHLTTDLPELWKQLTEEQQVEIRALYLINFAKAGYSSDDLAKEVIAIAKKVIPTQSYKKLAKEKPSLYVNFIAAYALVVCALLSKDNNEMKVMVPFLEELKNNPDLQKKLDEKLKFVQMLADKLRLQVVSDKTFARFARKTGVGFALVDKTQKTLNDPISGNKQLIHELDRTSQRIIGKQNKELDIQKARSETAARKPLIETQQKAQAEKEAQLAEKKATEKAAQLAAKKAKRAIERESRQLFLIGERFFGDIDTLEDSSSSDEEDVLYIPEMDGTPAPRNPDFDPKKAKENAEKVREEDKGQNTITTIEEKEKEKEIPHIFFQSSKKAYENFKKIINKPTGSIKITFDEAEALITGLGFARRPGKGDHRVYTREATSGRKEISITLDYKKRLTPYQIDHIKDQLEAIDLWPRLVDHGKG